MLISFEGIDGCGKSTQAQLLAEYLRSKGLTVHLVREPGGTPVSEKIRSLLLDATLEMDAFSEMLLFSAARAELVRTKLAPLLERGDVVICDRFFDSTTAYQGGGRRIADPSWLDRFQRMVTNGLVPDRTYYIRVERKAAEVRMNDRAGPGEEDRMERAGDEFFERVQEAYDHLSSREPERILPVDGGRSIDKIQALIRNDIERILKGRGGN